MQTFEDYNWKDAEDIFRKVDQACREVDVQFYLIGAQAINFNYLHANHPQIRTTKDFDFAVLVPNLEVYEELQSLLIKQGFKKTEQPYRLVFIQNDCIVDLIPFGELAEGGKVSFKSQLEFSVVGLREINARAKKYAIQGVTYSISPIDGLFLLKLIAYSERPEQRLKDLDDVHSIISRYFDLNSDRFYEDHLDLIDLLEETHFMEEAGACLLGRDLRDILDLSTGLKQTILDIFNGELSDQPGKIGKYFVQKGYFDTWEDFKRVFSLIYQYMQ